MRSIKTNKTYSKRNSIIASVVAILLVGGVASAFFIPGSPFALNHSKVADNPENTVDYNKPTAAQQAAGDHSKQEFNDKVYGNSSGTTGSAGSGSTGSSSSEGSAAPVSISSANQNNGILQIRTVIAEITTTGNCKLTLEQAGQATVTQSAGTQVLGSYSVCQGFDVPTAGMAKGQWKATIIYTDQAGKTSSTSQVLEV